MERMIIKNISKEFKKEKYSKPILKTILNLNLLKFKKESTKVLRDISFKINSNEIVGLIGKNGSGKSTLLRIISGIYKQDKGKIKINGKIISMINLYTGLQDMLTMKENIYLLGILFGLSKKEIKNRIKEIIKFSELEEYVNTKLYKFSNGMLQRIAFSTAIYCNPKILLLDEVFEIGDEKFRKKSIRKMKQLVKEGISIILVSHDLEMIEKYCNKVIWIEDGVIKEEGNPKDTIKKYLTVHGE
ncbi:MAG: ATP-binding cassette domain-containing protein [Candidatus Pacearchaeota archaeon]